MSIYLGVFQKQEDVVKGFEIDPSALDGATILMAWYGYGQYDGEAFVVFERDGKLYEVHGSHCSCNGLGGQWEPEETSWEALEMRKWSNYSDDEDKAESAMKRLIEEHK